MKPSKKLEELNASSYDYLVSVKDIFDSICTPLYQLGISFFNYAYIFKDGTYFSLNSNLALQKKYLTSIEAVDTRLVQDMFSSTRRFFKTANINKYNKNDHMMHLMYSFNIWYFLNIFERSHDSYIVYSFGLKKDSDNPIEFYLNTLPLIERFIEYFNEEASIIIDIKDVRKRAHYNQSFNFHSKSEEKIFEEKIQHFLQDMTEKRQIMRGKHDMVKLSAREIDCLNYLALGYGVKGVASILGLSPRTVETHINKAKQRTNFYTKQELLTNFISSFKPALASGVPLLLTREKFKIN